MKPYDTYTNRSMDNHGFYGFNWFHAQAECNKMGANLARADRLETVAFLSDITHELNK